MSGSITHALAQMSGFSCFLFLYCVFFVINVSALVGDGLDRDRSYLVFVFIVLCVFRVLLAGQERGCAHINRFKPPAGLLSVGCSKAAILPSALICVCVVYMMPVVCGVALDVLWLCGCGVFCGGVGVGCCVCGFHFINL